MLPRIQSKIQDVNKLSQVVDGEYIDQFTSIPIEDTISLLPKCVMKKRMHDNNNIQEGKDNIK